MVGYHHESLVMNKECTLFASTYSNARTKALTTLFSISYNDGEGEGDPNDVRRITVTPLIRISINPTNIFSFEGPSAPKGPEFFQFTSSLTSESFHGAYLLPCGGSGGPVGPPYPTVLHVYGGPHVQLVTDSVNVALNQSKLRALSNAGFLVVIAENTGSSPKGRRYTSKIYGRLGHHEVSDQVDCLKHLISQGLVDPTRVAVSGWSYGGYMSLMCITKHPDLFKLAVAGAPVTMWEVIGLPSCSPLPLCAINSPLFVLS